MGDLQILFPSLSVHSSRTILKRFWFVRSSKPLQEITFVANNSDLWPILIPIWAVTCQLCPGLLKVQAVVSNSMVGVTQLTSDTSVEPALVFPSFQGSKIRSSRRLSNILLQPGLPSLIKVSFFNSLGIVLSKSIANSISSSVNLGAPICLILEIINSLKILLGILL